MRFYLTDEECKLIHQIIRIILKQYRFYLTDEECKLGTYTGGVGL